MRKVQGKVFNKQNGTILMTFSVISLGVISEIALVPEVRLAFQELYPKLASENPDFAVDYSTSEDKEEVIDCYQEITKINCNSFDGDYLKQVAHTLEFLSFFDVLATAYQAAEDI